MADIEGDENNNTINGTSSADAINGKAGDDTITGQSGNDTIFGGDGDDTIDGGSGNDTIWAGSGRDTVSGGSGNDDIHGGDGHDTIDGGWGGDTIDAGEGNDTVSGGGGSDSILGSLGDDVIYGEDGHDTIDGGEGDDTISGGYGDDRVIASDGHDVITDAGGNDTIDGGRGDDTIDGGVAQDMIDGGQGNDDIHGGGGNDTIDGNRGNDVIDGDRGQDDITGGEGNDTIFGGSGDDTIDGGADDDVIFGGEGNDAITGGAGEDIIVGGRGDDIMSAGNNSTTDTFVIRDGDGHDTIADFTASEPDIIRFDMVEMTTYQDVVDRMLTHGSDTIIRYDNGQTTRLVNTQPAQLSAVNFEFGSAPICLSAGTLIETPQGPRLIESLKAGDLVMTLDHGPQVILTVLREVFHFRSADDRRKPIRVAKGALGEAVPDRDTVTSPQHRLLVRCPMSGEEMLVPAVKLLRRSGVRRMKGRKRADYYNLLLLRHEIVFANGCPVETLLLTEITEAKLAAMGVRVSLSPAMKVPARPLSRRDPLFRKKRVTHSAADIGRPSGQASRHSVQEMRAQNPQPL